MKLEIKSKGFVKADPLQIYQLLMNLCINAAEAIEDEGEITIKVEDIELKGEDLKRFPELKPGKYVKVSTIDTGIGIEENNLYKIFEPYFTTKEKGTGLGLTIVRKITEELGGKIGVESVSGRGSNFYFLLPRIDNFNEK